jgi:hypothetical protein
VCMMLAFAVFLVIVCTFGHPTGKLGQALHEEHQWIRHLTMIQDGCKYQVTFATVVLNYYVNQFHNFFQETHVTMRTIQGKINDFMLLLASCATRDMEGSFTTEAQVRMEDVGCSVATPMGLERMAQRVLMSYQFCRVLTHPPRTSGLLVWNG